MLIYIYKELSNVFNYKEVNSIYVNGKKIDNFPFIS